MAMNNTTPKKPIASSHSNLCTTLFFIVVFTIPAFLLLHTPTTTSICTTFAAASHGNPWSDDLLAAEFSWNRLAFSGLKIAVFCRKWPAWTTPGGMERHAYTLHTALSRRGHQVHIFTPPPSSPAPPQSEGGETGPLIINYREGEPGRWRYNKAWEQFETENNHGPFDVVHSESVALPHWLGRNVGNLAVSWHGIALESLQSEIVQDLTRKRNEPMSPAFSQSVRGVIPKVLNEIRFFKSYANHVAISDSCGEMLREMYQIPNRRVHVILNGVDEEDFDVDTLLGKVTLNHMLTNLIIF